MPQVVDKCYYIARNQGTCRHGGIIGIKVHVAMVGFKAHNLVVVKGLWYLIEPTCFEYNFAHNVDTNFILFC